MTPLTKAEAKRLCEALDYALNQVRKWEAMGLCGGLMDANDAHVITWDERNYLDRWIGRQLRGCGYLESWGGLGEPLWRGLTRYGIRKPWVEWMKKHLMETST